MKAERKIFTIIVMICVFFISSLTHTEAKTKKINKEEYYKEYQKIIRQANKRLGSEEFSLDPLDKIKEKNMLSPKDFKDSVYALMEAEKTPAIIEDSTPNEENDVISPYASGETVSKTKSHTYKVGNVSVKISCRATFLTRYNSTSKRRFITSIKSYSSTVSGSGYHWKSTPTSSKKIIDGGRTGYIQYTGVITNSSGYSKKVSPSYSFYCNSGGGIS